MLNWYAVHTRPRQEAIAELNLERQGYRSYLPRILLRKRRRDKWKKVVEPLFPRYLFIQVDPNQQSLSPVRSTLGVAGIVRFGNRLHPVPDSVIGYIRQAKNPETSQQRADAWSHQPGNAVQILEGPLAGLSGIFQAANGEERATIDRAVGVSKHRRRCHGCDRMRSRVRGGGSGFLASVFATIENWTGPRFQALIASCVQSLNAAPKTTSPTPALCPDY